MQGTVRWFNCAKGYGFIDIGDGGLDVFVHHVNIRMDGYRFLTEGQRVSFECAETEKGRAATSVVVLADGEATS